MLPRAPRSTLFPYTTLFRSASFSRATPAATNKIVEVGPPNETSRATEITLDLPRAPRLFAAKVANDTTDHRPQTTGDRKSTRLNSSHRTISYAVFCLKKKKE